LIKGALTASDPSGSTLRHRSAKVSDMKIELTPEQQDFVRLALESGRIQRAEDAVQEAMWLWVERERRRTEILEAVDAAEASLARGEGTVITHESMRELAEDVNRRGRARLAVEGQARR
jgi:Arc/MetJ-type ribon-helix-helix transcriptional regulator